MTSLKDVAVYTGLSISTVSRTLSGASYVKEETRQRVLEAVRILNYSPNLLAQGLKKGRSNTVVLMIPSIQNMIYPDLTRGVEDTARKKGFTVILCNTDESVDIEKAYLKALKPRLIDGFIIASMMPHSTHIQQLRKEQCPVVLALRACDTDIDAVVINNCKAAYTGTKYLIERGHREIAIALGDETVPLYAERYNGYRQALVEADIAVDEALVMRERYGVSSFYSMTTALLERGIRPDAFFATNDERAIVIMRALYDAGVSIPADVSVMGFDNVTMAALVEPPLSTIAQPFYNIGALAMEKLIYQIQYKEKHGILDEPVIDTVDTSLIVRKSTR
ncbi:MAG: LacI family transcriptional regulator [Treponema sp.]|jgi:LacI family transcriptional regulator|nr:LacI family transcriptional regulator [Treponema sp.]